ncbi:hypothetical protein [Prevotella sp.]|uniref:hypothetical protein n=1 Tax=Prevotella sp. TaxID=59823 RepID=UPI0027E29A53|nr:hypothetical protein [Prevotella sp.]
MLGRECLSVEVAINTERDKQNNSIRASSNKTYTYYMQQLNKLIIENKALQNENEDRKERRQNVRNRQDKTDTKVYLTVSLVKVINSFKPFRNQAK